MSGSEWLARPRRRGGGRALDRRGRWPVAPIALLGQRRAGGRDRCHDRKLARAAVGLGRIGGDHRHARARRHRRLRLLEQVQPKRVGPNDEHEVVRLERLAHQPPAPVQMPGEQRVVLREPGARAERLLPHGAVQALGQRRQRAPSLGAVEPAPTTIAGFSARAMSSTRSWSSVDEIDVALTTCAGAFAASFVGGLLPVAHRHDHERGAGGRLRLVVRARDRARDVLGAGRRSHEHGVFAGEPIERRARSGTARTRSAGGPAGRRRRPVGRGCHARWRSR